MNYTKSITPHKLLLFQHLKHQRIDEARDVFNKLPFPDIALCTQMVMGYAQNDRLGDALKLFYEMPTKDVVSWNSIMKGCLDCGDLSMAKKLFDEMPEKNVVSWTTIMNGFLQFGRVENAECLFRQMSVRDIAAWNAMIHGYCSNGRVEDALNLFEKMPRRNVISWTSIIGGLDQNGKSSEALFLFQKMVHAVYVGNSLVVMYTKCGYVYDGITAFKRIDEKNIVSWNSSIVGCAQHGLGMWALTLFNQMLRERVDPDEVTFIGLLSACSHSFMLQKGRCFFQYMSQVKSIEMTIEHYACMLDVLGRCGELEEAEQLVENMPMKANVMVWLVLLSACRKHSKIDVAERAAEQIFELEPECSAAYVLLSNLYASAGRWSDVSRIRKKMKHNRVVKQPGSSWLTLKGQRHQFLSGDRSHPLNQEIYQKLDWLGGKLKELGYVPDQQFSLHDVEVEQKEEMLSYHSERLAIGFGLISTVEGSTITVMKNLRVCGDCHTAIKLMANIVGREIIVRDYSRFHHFRSGICSCGDYW
ncbi:Pentatricopeptide repeat [Quillaja saponaria]|uniref:Pentatricopeptide repeat n=1 Tax=Quillaja saponaria TaxID=32244 RepID=A0AAD7M2M5_QUISA|nr:Pentatricopeptide repeat [Quillaja saponaria]